jgi:hypothetical protein
MIPQIPTEYKHTQFNSRLDARWAVFFEKLGFRWQYLLSTTGENPAPAYSPKFWLADQQAYADVRFQEPPANLRKRMARYARGHALWVIIGTPAVQFEDNQLDCEYVVHRFQFSDELEDQQTLVAAQANAAGARIIQDADLPGWSEEVFAICNGCGKTVGLLARELLFSEQPSLPESSEDRFCCSEAAGSANHKRLLAAYHAAMNERFEGKRKGT